MSKRTRRTAETEIEVYRIPFEGGGEIPSKESVGSKAHNLMRMARRGLPVPPGFVLGTSLCRAYLSRGKAALAGLERIIERELENLGAATGRRFGDPKRPLLVSVRSGAAVSMPGMMETVLNVGLTDATPHGLLRLTGNPRLAADCQRRLVQQFAEVVHGVAPARFDMILDARLAEQRAAGVHELDSEALAELAAAYRTAFHELAGASFPESPLAQLTASVEAVLRSWMSPRACEYRKLNAIPDDIGTATIVQYMAFGNAGPTSGSGVGFTRNPSDGSKTLYVDFLANAQGEDVVAGRLDALGMGELERRMPEAFAQLVAATGLLEEEFGDMQDFEFTVEDGHLYILQARAGKRTPLAALRIAIDLVLGAIETVELAPPPGMAPLARAVPASVGVSVGVAVFDTERVAAYKEKGRPVILLRDQTETSDIQALAEAEALVTAHGARTSHAAVVARQLGKVCLVACQSLRIDGSARGATLGGSEIKEGETLTVDGTTGSIFRGEIPVRRVKPTDLVKLALSWSKSPARQ